MEKVRCIIFRILLYCVFLSLDMDIKKIIKKKLMVEIVNLNSEKN